MKLSSITLVLRICAAEAKRPFRFDLFNHADSKPNANSFGALISQAIVDATEIVGFELCIWGTQMDDPAGWTQCNWRCDGKRSSIE